MPVAMEDISNYYSYSTHTGLCDYKTWCLNSSPIWPVPAFLPIHPSLSSSENLVSAAQTAWASDCFRVVRPCPSSVLTEVRDVLTGLPESSERTVSAVNQWAILLALHFPFHFVLFPPTSKDDQLASFCSSFLHLYQMQGQVLVHFITLPSSWILVYSLV